VPSAVRFALISAALEADGIGVNKSRRERVLHTAGGKEGKYANKGLRGGAKPVISKKRRFPFYIYGSACYDLPAGPFLL
jgi:hypothetical protein